MAVGGNITFTCTHNGSYGSSLFWELNITNRTTTAHATTATNLRDKPGMGTSATKNTAQPVNITVYNLQLANNGSTVKCQLETEGSPAVILVEGMMLHSIYTPSSIYQSNNHFLSAPHHKVLARTHIMVQCSTNTCFAYGDYHICQDQRQKRNTESTEYIS